MQGPAIGSFLLGLILGLLDPRPLYSVEIAQVISGLVTLPPEAAMGIHNGRVFSILIDAAAVLLSIGFSEGVVCRVLSALMGGLSCMTMSLVAFAFTSNRLAAFAAPYLMMGYGYASGVHKYPLLYPVSEYDLGINGFHFALLSLSLLALHVRAGALLVGLMPGIHASLAGAVWLITGLGLLFDSRMARALRDHRRWLAAGVLLVILAWMAQQHFGPVLPPGPEQADLRYARAFAAGWDVHRAPIDATVIEFAFRLGFDVAFMALAVTALVARPEPLRHVRFWVAGQAVVTMLAVGVTVADQYQPGWAPLAISAAMIPRWLNLNVVVLPALVVGWAVRSRGAQAVAMMDRVGIGSKMRVAAIGAAAVVRLGLEFSPNFDLWGPNQPLLDRAGTRPGVLLAFDDVEFTQLQTRRPVLLDTDLLDALPYAPAAGPAMERILNDVYGASLLSPRFAMQFDSLRQRWEGRTDADWIRLKREYGVTDVLVPAHWNLKLPRVDASSSMALYAISRVPEQ